MGVWHHELSVNSKGILLCGVIICQSYLKLLDRSCTRTRQDSMNWTSSPRTFPLGHLNGH